MSMNVTPVKAAVSAVNAVVPKTKAAKSIALGESIMPKKQKHEKTSPAKTIIIKIFETFVDKAKAKPDSERNVVDYILIVADKLKDINPTKYAA